ncbi:MAG: hypothetical protein PQJ61_12300 [Spirochaetales bacterium]|uniref:DUF5655 domain-containing protein n=1 Tax=Candidatus Thalassospirochaeta sargassi TaxID=3119039 RepID=A0AAJ1MKC0_9SPIO|nr:hypothetical protein [Spirochaetales bacterium]
MAKAIKVIGKFPKSNMKELYSNLTDDKFVKKHFPIKITIKAITERKNKTLVSAFNIKEWDQPSIVVYSVRDQNIELFHSNIPDDESEKVKNAWNTFFKTIK